jgi:hypothetical protein
VNEGGSVTVAATGNDPDGDTLTYDWDLDNNGSFETPGQSVSFSAATIDGPDTRTIKVRAMDPGGHSAVSSATVMIENVPPTATFNAPPSVNEGSAIDVSLTAPSDPSSADTAAGFQYAFDCGDGSGFSAFAGTSSVSCPTSDDGSRTVKGRIRDKDGDATEYSAAVTVENVAPTATFNAPTSSFAGFAFTISLTSPHDAGSADTFTYAFDCGSGFGAFGASSSASCTSTTVGPLTVRGKIQDDDGGVTPYEATVDITVTFDSLCALTREYSSKKKVADDLCRELDMAEKAAAQGKTKAKEDHLKRYVKGVQAQAGKAFTQEEAATLVRLAESL